MNTDHPERYYVGYHMPVVEIEIQAPDPYYWERRKAAERLNRDEASLEDEPDFNPRMDIDND